MHNPSVTTSQATSQQLKFQDWELGLFLHFGIRTYFDNRRDWDSGLMSPEAFNPEKLDCEQWIKTASDAGFRYAVLTTKHHDGFALWPSEHTDYSVKSSPWRGGKGDVVREYVDACAKHRFGVGIYYSPAQVSGDGQGIKMENASAYDDYFIAQVSELLGGQYGSIDMIWFDGCGSENHSYDWPRIVKEIRRMQPDILIFNMADPDYRWNGNEAGLAQKPSWNVTDKLRGSDKEMMTAPKWLPVECDLMLHDKHWFFEHNDEHTIKSVEELLGIYSYSVGRGANMLLNVGPNPAGLLPLEDSQRLHEFGAAIQQRFSNPIVSLTGSELSFKDNRCTWRPEKPVLIDQVILAEDTAHGEHVRDYVIEIDSYLDSQEATVIYDGENIGHKAICTFPPVRARAVHIRIRKSEGPVQLKTVSIHHVGNFHVTKNLGTSK